MRISKKPISASIVALFVATVTVQSFSTVQAQPKGYVQADCPNIVKQAIDTVSAQCGKTTRGKLCYGNANITAQFQPGANNIHFSAPGDTVDVSAIKQFTLSGMDTTHNSWGVAEMKIKADLPGADPSQAVTMILFGDVQLSDASSDANAAALTQQPSTTATPQNQPALTATANAVNQQATKAAATATKIVGLEATATAHALTPTPTGTIPALKATQAAATATKLAALENTATAVFAPNASSTGSKGLYSGLQAFYFQSSDTAPCDQAPHDGILIQSPQGSKQRVSLNINGASISLGSTVYITAQPGKFLTINTLEGSAIITAAGQTQTANAGTVVQVPLDATLHASGAPMPAVYYIADAIRALPTGLFPDTSAVFAGGLPSNLTFSNWTETNTWSISSGTNCSNGKNVSDVVKLAYNDTDMWLNGLVLTQSGGGSYYFTATFPQVNTANTITNVFSFSVIDPTHISGTLFLTVANNGGKCVLADMINLTAEATP